MSKLPNVKGRISYITSHAKQENLYATYRTADNTFWKNLARESQQEFQRSGTTGKCIEARELIIALPEIYTTFDPQQVLEEFTDKFRQQYGVECVSALHHNKRKTNYHIHLILLWSSIFVTLMANKIGGLQFGIYRNCQISSRVFHTAVAALPLTKANRSDFE